MGKKRISNKKQQEEIMKLLTVWPSAPYETIEEFVIDTLGVTPTRSVISLAKQNLEQLKPSRNEKTEAKRVYTRYCVMEAILQYGPGMLSDAQLFKRIEVILLGKFQENTNTANLKSWIQETKDEIRDMTPHKLRQEMELVKAEFDSNPKSQAACPERQHELF